MGKVCVMGNVCLQGGGVGEAKGLGTETWEPGNKAWHINWESIRGQMGERGGLPGRNVQAWQGMGACCGKEQQQVPVGNKRWGKKKNPNWERVGARHSTTTMGFLGRANQRTGGRVSVPVQTNKVRGTGAGARCGNKPKSQTMSCQVVGGELCVRVKGRLTGKGQEGCRCV